MEHSGVCGKKKKKERNRKYSNFFFLIDEGVRERNRVVRMMREFFLIQSMKKSDLSLGGKREKKKVLFVFVYLFFFFLYMKKRREFAPIFLDI